MFAACILGISLIPYAIDAIAQNVCFRSVYYRGVTAAHCCGCGCCGCLHRSERLQEDVVLKHGEQGRFCCRHRQRFVQSAMIDDESTHFVTPAHIADKFGFDRSNEIPIHSDYESCGLEMNHAKHLNIASNSISSSSFNGNLLLEKGSLEFQRNNIVDEIDQTDGSNATYSAYI